jgi:hypothetical protein
VRTRNKKRHNIDFSRGMDAWNKESLQGSQTNWQRSHPFNLRENAPGYVDDIVNFVFDDTGQLVGRKGIYPHGLPMNGGPDNAVNETTRLLTHRSNSLMSFGRFQPSPATTYEVYRQIPGDGGTFTSVGLTVSAGTQYLSAVHYGTFWYYYTGADNGSAWTVADSGSAIVSYTLDLPNWGPAPAIGNLFIWKDRAWGYSLETFAWSKATDPKVWLAPDGGFAKIDERISDMHVLNDTLYILTNTNALWAFSYDSDPGVDGYLRKIVQTGTIPGGGNGGLTGSHNLAVYQNELYITGNTNIWKLINNNPYPVADPLHLGLNDHGLINIWNAGEYLLCRTVNSDISTTPTTYYGHDLYLYSGVNDAWTRLDIPFYADDAQNARVFLHNAFYDANDEDETAMVLFLSGNKHQTYPNADFPIYRLPLNLNYNKYRPNSADTIVVDFNGGLTFYIDGGTGKLHEGGKDQRMIKHKIKTGPIYPNGKEIWSRFLYIIFEGYLSWRQRGTNAVNESPYKTTISYIPQALTDKTDNTIVRPTETVAVDNPFVIPINQRARGVQFTFETEDTITWADLQYPDDAADNVDAAPIISQLSLMFQELEISRFRPGSALKSDANAN